MKVDFQPIWVGPPTSGTGEMRADPAAKAADPQAETTPLQSPKEKEKQQEVQKDVKREDLDHVVDKMNQAVKLFNHSLQFSVSDKHRVVIKVIDTSSGEVIRQIPPEALMDAFSSFDKMIGVMFDRKV